jgi:hypothetical protein
VPEPEVATPVAPEQKADESHLPMYVRNYNEIGRTVVAPVIRSDNGQVLQNVGDFYFPYVQRIVGEAYAPYVTALLLQG